MAGEQQGWFSLWSEPRSFDAARARTLAERALELRGRSEDEVRARAAYLDLLAPGPGERVLDVGCGSGVVTRDLARRVASGGQAVGLDPSTALLAVAEELASEAGLAGQIAWREGDARALPFDDGTFDAALAVTALCHIPDGERAIPELVRVVRPGGRIGIFDRDNDSYIIAHPDRALTRRIVAAGSDHSTVDGWLIRRLPRLLRQAGLVDVRADRTAMIAAHRCQQCPVARACGARLSCSRLTGCGGSDAGPRSRIARSPRDPRLIAWSRWRRRHYRRCGASFTTYLRL